MIDRIKFYLYMYLRSKNWQTINIFEVWILAFFLILRCVIQYSATGPGNERWRINGQFCQRYFLLQIFNLDAYWINIVEKFLIKNQFLRFVDVDINANGFQILSKIFFFGQKLIIKTKIRKIWWKNHRWQPLISLIQRQRF